MELVKTYDNPYLDIAKNMRQDVVKMHIPMTDIDSNGNILSASYDNFNNINKVAGIVFIVDKHIPEQFEKLQIKFEGNLIKLIVKEGEIIDEPILSEAEKELKELEERKIELQSQLEQKEQENIEKNISNIQTSWQPL